MKATIGKSQRRVHLTELPTEIDGLRNMPETLTIFITYAEDDPSPNITKGICLENIVIPAIVEALNIHAIKKRMDYLRGEIEAQRISYKEIAELQSLAPHIPPDDMLLLEWAGVPER